MPRYDYRCVECAEEFEVEQRFSDPALRTHDACGGRLAKIYRTPGVVFKGSGWHSKDYGK